ncbi:MAG: undecaprenyl/decaprenyl-phosphate alpha-N-acetylglucosaminyl 1-phosphate transferase [Bacilli bacterium]|nr:undecaprenyl/decaprenyl-phosphate alpha-N-acetylglucosaminyl 1-phosphate transferase [Bacilli bacterium]
MHVKEIIYMIVIPFLFVLAIIPFIKKVAAHVGAMDIPDKRKVHKKPMPRMGGLGIYMGFLLGYILFGTMSLKMNAILIGSFIIIVTGIVDDIKPIPAKVKFLFQIIAASVVAFYGQILLQDLSAFGFYIDFGIFSYPITILFIVAIINCINLIDGMDGLAAGLSSIYFITIGIVAVLWKHSFGLDAVITFIMLGATLGFLCHNFNPAKIFMGDSGSMFLGYIIAVIALLGFKNVTLTTLLAPICLLAIPIMDTLFAILRRLVNKKPISEPDKEHLHHQLLNLNLSHRNVVLVIYALDILFASAMLIYMLYDRTVGVIMYSMLFIVVLIFIIKTNIIIDHRKKEKSDVTK